MPRAKIAMTLERALLRRLDHLVCGHLFANRSQAIQQAVSEKLDRLDRTRLAREFSSHSTRRSDDAPGRNPRISWPDAAPLPPSPPGPDTMGMPLAHRRFTVDEYYRMAEVGILGPDDRVELLDGEIVEMSPIGARHAATVTRLQRLFERLAGHGAIVRVQQPVRLDPYSEPEPDIALVRPRADFYAEAHPTPGDVLLIVEVADTSLRSDRHRKLPTYARARIPDVWLVDLSTDRVEQNREPRGDAYAERQILGPEATLTPLLLPDVAIRVGELF